MSRTNLMRRAERLRVRKAEKILDRKQRAEQLEAEAEQILTDGLFHDSARDPKATAP